ncbi:cell wall-associated NlpC family hydrolase [Sphingomonas endophytica]|jgi:cell wall-associated NlpC family hydrolase|uniref:Cell wall-associated NlpC family hydrolase n=1 Tax=Sphingomonas endophytica TaxID=869719 RepID=A0A7X0JFB8_9SPHN|nr:peptidoglycan endopeptidase [Sphingomonas endophytica]MBB6506220.1 cell wall-associated NlpC family hydrolase [Sphingomonas endophytica]
MTAGERVLAAARTLVGVRFRAQGRDPALGLDCVGVVAVALCRAGAAVTLPRDYAVARGRVPPGAVPAALRPCDGAWPGDVLLCRVAAMQLHLAVRAVDGIIHADAQARRVVARPGAVPWPIEGAWRWTPQGG